MRTYFLSLGRGFAFVEAVAWEANQVHASEQRASALPQVVRR